MSHFRKSAKISAFSDKYFDNYFIIMRIVKIHLKNSFAEVSNNLVRYRSKNNFVELSK